MNLRISYKSMGLAGLLLLLGLTANGQQRTMSMYRDWTVSCAMPNLGGRKTCVLMQIQKTEGESPPVSQVAVGRPGNKEPFRISIEVLPNAWIPTGVTLVIDEKEMPISATFRWCLATRCLADAQLTDADIKKLRAQKGLGQIAYKNASLVDVSIPVSFSGFSEAMDALQKE